jgi:pyruvate formate lyase activating enzyme
VYGRYTSCAFDPIEKKPLYHFFPGSYIISLGPNACNFHCVFCQNYEISQQNCSTHPLSPQETVELALRENSLGLSFTYSEPLVWYEYLLETARLAHQNRLKNTLVTNGFINLEPLQELLPYIDAMNIDLKSIKEDFYQKYCRGALKPVLETIKFCYSRCHIELTNLIIPTLNDRESEIEELVSWVANLSPSLPLHFSRYFPRYKLSLPPTPLETLKRAYRIARQKLHYVYLGNILDEESSTTFCPKCHTPAIRRLGYEITDNTHRGKCPHCNQDLNIIC